MHPGRSSLLWKEILQCSFFHCELFLISSPSFSYPFCLWIVEPTRVISIKNKVLAQSPTIHHPLPMKKQASKHSQCRSAKVYIHGFWHLKQWFFFGSVPFIPNHVLYFLDVKKLGAKCPLSRPCPNLVSPIFVSQYKYIVVYWWLNNLLGFSLWKSIVSCMFQQIWCTSICVDGILKKKHVIGPAQRATLAYKLCTTF